MHKNELFLEGNTENPQKAIIMLHGRGSSAQEILALARHLEVEKYLLAAPQATNNTWYPLSFLAKPEENEPKLSAAFDLVKKTITQLEQRNILKENIYLLGFSQGACLSLEFAARNATKYGGVIAFSGGLMGEQLDKRRYNGHFENTPIFIGCSDKDFHIPLPRVYASTNILKDMGAEVTEKIYPHMGHTIIQEEIEQVKKKILKK